MASQEPFDDTGRSRYPNYWLPLREAKRRAQSRDVETVQQAIEELRELRELYPHVVAVEQELALAYIEMSTLVPEEQHEEFEAKAEKILDDLRQDPTLVDEETLGKLGRLHKQRAWSMNKPGNPPQKGEEIYYRSALGFYAEAYELHKHYYPGINVATLLLLLSEQEEANRIANEVLTTCSQLRPSDDVERNWVAATQGEAQLVLGEYKLACAHYRTAMSLDPTEAYAESPRRHALCILAKRPPADQCLARQILEALKISAGPGLKRRDRGTGELPAPTGTA